MGWWRWHRTSTRSCNPQSSFYLARAPRVHMVVGQDYAEYVRHFRAGTTSSYQDHDEEFMREVADASKALPRMFIDLVLPRLPELEARLDAGARVLDVGCGGGWAIVQIAEVSKHDMCRNRRGAFLRTSGLQRLVAERQLTDRCEARRLSVDQLDEVNGYDVATSFLVVHEIPPALKAGSVRGDGPGAATRRLPPDLRRGLSRKPTRPCRRCRPVRHPRPVVRYSRGATWSTPAALAPAARRRTGAGRGDGFSASASWSARPADPPVRSIDRRPKAGTLLVRGPTGSPAGRPGPAGRSRPGAAGSPWRRGACACRPGPR